MESTLKKAEVMVDPSVRVKVIPREVKFKDTSAESSKACHKHSTCDGSSSNPIALFYKKLTCMETRIMNQLKRNDRRNKRRFSSSSCHIVAYCNGHYASVECLRRALEDSKLYPAWNNFDPYRGILHHFSLFRVDSMLCSQLHN
ncbi:hypothetical protein PIB30_030748 [Stylosanthes scabra]|uniref:Uncharacterized protein n=1 Tax=Stylosanthes scabra TaxID=79078 RepID=A0ABU6XBF9_9FABA|nr:hypothetical protein [Stylosanthes scabra]